MDAARFARVKEVFVVARTMRAGERRAFLDEALGEDTGLRAEVEALLVQHDDASGFLDGSVLPDDAGASDAEPRALPDRIGPYRVLDQLAVGGMGVVYLAEQGRPARTVALKVLRADSLAPALVQRFRREVDVLGRLQHPGIAQVHEAGVHAGELGEQPWFAMELVVGASITEHASERGLSVRERVQLFAQVCDAVHHAHERGVVHRDLKPSNVMVDVNGRPKVLDFGVARLVQEEERASLRTRTGQLLGTLAYMSPEQAAGGAARIDARSDVYALGVMLYELLAGRLPYSVNGLLVHEAVRTIREEDPTALRTLDPALRGDLETIAGKALAKDPERRYASARALAEDLRRFLDDRPIAARTPSTTYQVAKLVRRHRGIAAGVGIAFVALAAGLVTTLLALRRELAAKEAGSRLSDWLLAGELEREEDVLWPATPEMLPELELWLARADMLVARLPEHRAHLERLGAAREDRPRADFDGEQSPERLRSASPCSARVELAGEQRPERLETVRPGVSRAERADEHDLPGTAKTPTGTRARRDLPDDQDSPGSEWTWTDQERLVARIASLSGSVPGTGAIARMRERAEVARTLEERTVTHRRAEWDASIAAIADRARCPRYSGLHIRPQIGLVPLGPDPDSNLWEFALEGWTGIAPQRDPVTRKLRFDESCAIVLVLVPGGTAWIGAQASDPAAPYHDPAAALHEGPPTQIELAPYFLSKFEVTQAQWVRFTGSNPSEWEAGSAEKHAHTLICPVEYVDWVSADGFVRKLGLALPTEAQWEHAARGGTGTPWWTGRERSSLRDALAFHPGENGAEESSSEGAPYDRWEVHAPVGMFPANPLGLHEVLGNVTEWCADAFKVRYHDLEHRAGDGLVVVPEDDGDRIRRGGSCADTWVRVRSAYRSSDRSEYRSASCGLRPARRLDP